MKNGYQPKIATKGKPPTSGSSVQMPPPKVVFTDQTIHIPPQQNKAALIEQLNGLLDRYNDIYKLYSKIMYVNDHTQERLAKVLDNIEKAIEGVCFWLTHEVITAE